MEETPPLSELPKIIRQHFGLAVSSKPPLLLHEYYGSQFYQLELEDGSAVVARLYPSHGSWPYSRILNNVRVLRFLNTGSFPCPKVKVGLNGDALFEWQPGQWAYLSEYLEGENPPIEILAVIRTGRLLAQLHLAAPEDYPEENGWLEGLPQARELLQECFDHPRWGVVAQEISQIMKDLPDLRILPKGLIHCDIQEGNLWLSEEDELYLLDFSSTAQGEMLLDLALILLDWCLRPPQKATATPLKPDPLWPELEVLEFYPDFSRVLLGSYQELRPLSEVERGLLGPTVRFVAAWYALTRWPRK